MNHVRARSAGKWVWLVLATAWGGCMIEGEQLADLDPSEGSIDSIRVSCSDGVKNGEETDVDCGGSTCQPCERGKACGWPTDCGTGVCSSGVCCNEECSGACISCNRKDSVGICAYVPEGEPHDLYACSTTSACDGKGSCKALSGQPCKNVFDCMSGMCVSGKCK